MENQFEKLRTDCWDNALDCYALWYIYSVRVRKLEWWLRWTKILGILIPVFLGGLVTSYYQNEELMQWAIVITTPLALGQLLISTYLTISGADENYSKYVNLATEFNLLNSELVQLAMFPLKGLAENRSKYDVLIERKRGLSKSIVSLKDKELRMGMRSALRERRRSCAGCGETPISMDPSKCYVCGNF